MAQEESEDIQRSTLVSNLGKEYDADFDAFKNKWRTSMASEDILNPKGSILVLNTLDSLKNTMDPMSYPARTNMKVGTRDMISDSLTHLSSELIIYHERYCQDNEDTQHTISNLVHRLMTDTISFSDKWIGKYNTVVKKSWWPVIKIKELYLSIINLGKK